MGLRYRISEYRAAREKVGNRGGGGWEAENIGRRTKEIDYRRTEVVNYATPNVSDRTGGVGGE